MVVKREMKGKIVRLRELEILDKYLSGEPLDSDDIEFMEKISWHPVDEMEFKPGFVKSVKNASKGFTKRVKIEDL